MVNASKPVWVVRVGKHGERDAWCLANGCVGGGWEDLPDLSGCRSRADIEEVVRRVIGPVKPDAVANYTGQLWALRGRIAVGDTIVLPLKTTSQIAIGTCTRGYYYDPAESLDKRHLHGVRWERTDIPRTAVRQDLLYTLGSALTVFQAVKNDAAQRIAALAATGVDPGRGHAVAGGGGATVRPVPGSGAGTAVEDVTDEPEESPDIEVVARDRIVAHIAETFAGHRLAELVAAILRVKGFVCETGGPGADGGIDVVAGRGVLGLDAPRLIVQVKSGDSPVGDPVVRDLQGLVSGHQADQGLLVAWGGLTGAARANIAHKRFSIRVWDATAVVDAVLEAYADLPEGIRADLPLKPVWVLTEGE